MFKIGEFAKIAYINARLLRHYDEIGLLKPRYVDPDSGYRYYTADQLEDVNRLIVLKELGLSLEQIRRLMHENISISEIRGMLIMKKAQVEQTLHEEITRLRNIEARLAQMEDDGQFAEKPNVVVKSIPSQRWLSIRAIFPDFDHGAKVFHTIHKQLPSRLPDMRLGQLVAIDHTEEFNSDEPIDLEVGYLVKESPQNLEISIADYVATMKTLPAVDTMATVVQVGSQASYISHAVLGQWMATNRYQFDGTTREVYIQLHPHLVVEHQFPVRKSSHPFPG